MTRRLEELDLVAKGTWDGLAAHGWSPRDEHRQIGRAEQPFASPSEQVVPSRFALLVLEAWEQGELSEGQAARMLRTDRVALRRLMKTLVPNRDDVQLALPLADAGPR
jgi:hypothetical protein